MAQGAAAKFVKLSSKQACFVIEYLKDFAVRRAAEAAGYRGDEGHKILANPKVTQAVNHALQQRLGAPTLADADWLLYELIDNHRIARQQGSITASNVALGMIAKHKRVDAFASDKLAVSTDTDVRDRLVSARQRRRDSFQADHVELDAEEAAENLQRAAPEALPVRNPDKMSDDEWLRRVAAKYCEEEFMFM